MGLYYLKGTLTSQMISLLPPVMCHPEIPSSRYYLNEKRLKNIVSLLLCGLNHPGITLNQRYSRSYYKHEKGEIVSKKNIALAF